MKKNTTKDLRSPIAKARDKWKASAEFKLAADPLGLGAPAALKPYLEKRLERAFLAGAQAQLNISDKLLRRK